MRYYVTREGSHVRIALRLYGEVGWIDFYWDAGSEVGARAVSEAIADKTSQRIESIRRNAYNQGKRAARIGGEEKREFFSGCLNEDLC